MKAAAAYLAEMMQNPAKVVEHQVNYWGKTLKHYVEAQQTLAKGEFKAPPDPGPEGPPLFQSAVGDASVLQLPQAAVPAERRGDHHRRRRHGDAGPRRPPPGGVFHPPDRRHVQPDEFPWHQPRRAGKGGRDRRDEPGAGAGEPGPRHRDATRAIFWSRWPTARRSRSARTSPPRRARWSTATGCWS